MTNQPVTICLLISDGKNMTNMTRPPWVGGYSEAELYRVFF